MNRILDDFLEAAAPKWSEVVADFRVRGGFRTVVGGIHGERPKEVTGEGRLVAGEQ